MRIGQKIFQELGNGWDRRAGGIPKLFEIGSSHLGESLWCKVLEQRRLNDLGEVHYPDLIFQFLYLYSVF